MNKKSKLITNEFIPKPNWNHWGCNLPIDYMFLHDRAFLLFGKILLFRYTTSEDCFCLLLVDMVKKSIEPIQVTGKKVILRMKFAACLKENQIFSFGGIYSDLSLSSSLEVIDI